MKVECNKCKQEFDDECYVANNNELGFEDVLLTHIRKHENDEKLGEWFTNVNNR